MQVIVEIEEPGRAGIGQPRHVTAPEAVRDLIVQPECGQVCGNDPCSPCSQKGRADHGFAEQPLRTVSGAQFEGRLFQGFSLKPLFFCTMYMGRFLFSSAQMPR